MIAGGNFEYRGPQPPGFYMTLAMQYEPISMTEWPGLWHVAHTRTRQEKKLAEELSRLGIYYYLPLRQSVTRSRATRRVSRSMLPLFPGYLFFKGSEAERYRALQTNRIAQVLDVPDQQQLVVELQQIQRLLTGSPELFVTSHLKSGNWVRIIAGPLQGMEGVIEYHAKGAKLYLNVTTLGQSVSVEVASDLVEKIDPPSWIEVHTSPRRREPGRQ